jgi:hypothetical protein
MSDQAMADSLNDFTVRALMAVSDLDRARRF